MCLTGVEKGAIGVHDPYLYHPSCSIVFAVDFHNGFSFSVGNKSNSKRIAKDLQGVGIFSREEVSLATDSETDFKGHTGYNLRSCYEVFVLLKIFQGGFVKCVESFCNTRANYCDLTIRFSIALQNLLTVDMMPTR